VVQPQQKKSSTVHFYSALAITSEEFLSTSLFHKSNLSQMIKLCPILIFHMSVTQLATIKLLLYFRAI